MRQSSRPASVVTTEGYCSGQILFGAMVFLIAVTLVAILLSWGSGGDVQEDGNSDCVLNYVANPMDVIDDCNRHKLPSYWNSANCRCENLFDDDACIVLGEWNFIVTYSLPVIIEGNASIMTICPDYVMFDGVVNEKCIGHEPDLGDAWEDIRYKIKNNVSDSALRLCWVDDRSEVGEK